MTDIFSSDCVRNAVCNYLKRTGYDNFDPKGALIDMDGVLYDSMKYHTISWHRMMTEQGINCTRDEFYLYEGMTGAATINLLMQREKGITLPDDEVKRLYNIKKGYFIGMGRKEPMPGADRMLNTLREAGMKRVLVTGSAQTSLLDSLNADYPGAFLPELRVTALDVEHGKPNPEPYLKGLEKAGLRPNEAIVIENAPLGARAGVASGCFTIAITTGPVPAEKFEQENVDLIFPSMPDFADALPLLLQLFRNE